MKMTPYCARVLGYGVMNRLPPGHLTVRAALLPEICTYAAEDDVSDAFSNRLVTGIDRMPTAFALQPAFIIHDAFYIGDFRTDEFGFLVHRLI